MADISYKQEILEQLDRLDSDKQRQVLEYARGLSHPRGEPGWLIIQRTRKIHIDHADLEEMQQAIEEECERIDLGEWWNKPMFPD